LTNWLIPTIIKYKTQGAQHMAKLIYEHSDGHQTVVEFDAATALDKTALGQRAWDEVWNLLLEEVKLDAQRSTDVATNA